MRQGLGYPSDQVIMCTVTVCALGVGVIGWGPPTAHSGVVCTAYCAAGQRLLDNRSGGQAAAGGACNRSPTGAGWDGGAVCRRAWEGRCALQWCVHACVRGHDHLPLFSLPLTCALPRRTGTGHSHLRCHGGLAQVWEAYTAVHAYVGVAAAGALAGGRWVQVYTLRMGRALEGGACQWRARSALLRPSVCQLGHHRWLEVGQLCGCLADCCRQLCGTTAQGWWIGNTTCVAMLVGGGRKVMHRRRMRVCGALQIVALTPGLRSPPRRLQVREARCFQALLRALLKSK